MRALILISALGLSACAEVTEHTSITPEEQTCLGLAIASAPASMTIAEKIRAANLACFIAPGTPGSLTVVDADALALLAAAE